MREVEFGRYVYVQIPALAALGRRDAAVKPWISEEVPQSPVGLWNTGVSGFAGVRDLVAVGGGRDAGVPVERYSGLLVLGQAAAANPELRSLLGRFGSLRTLFDKPVTVRFDIGDDGYLRGVGEAFTIRLPDGLPLSLTMSITMSGFGAPVAALRPPPAGSIMTSMQLQELVGAKVGVIA